MISWINEHPVIVAVPLVATWLIVLTDIVLQRALSTPAKWLWTILCTLFWPLLIVYWLTRPLPARGQHVAARDDPRGRLVRAALDHEMGRIDDARMNQIVATLRDR